MQAQVVREGDVMVVQLAGRIDVETAPPFRKACLEQLINEKVVFDFRNLSFVGSSGILPFLETMQEFAGKSRHGFKFSAMSSEFRRIFGSTPLQTIEVFETYSHAVHAFHHPIASAQSGQAAPPVPLQAQQFAIDDDGAAESIAGFDVGTGSAAPTTPEEGAAADRLLD